MGFEPKTELFAKCLLDLELARRRHAPSSLTMI